VLATKYTLSKDPTDPNAGGSHRKSLRRAVDASLKRLGTDYIDLYWVHIWDAFTPVEEVIQALDDLVRSGKVLYIGISDTPAWIVTRAVILAEERGLTPFCALHVPYSLVERTVERELLPMARASILPSPDGHRLAADCSPDATAPTATALPTAAWPASEAPTNSRPSPNATSPSPMRSTPSPRRAARAQAKWRSPGYARSSTAP
jgi:hypothetical protein